MDKSATRPILVITITLALTGCQTIAANFATNMAIDLALRPVTHLVVEGGKELYRSMKPSEDSDEILE
jgi:hypothetical protein